MKKSSLHGELPSEEIIRKRMKRGRWSEEEARSLPVGAKRDRPTAHYRAPIGPLTQQRVLELFNYDPETGKVTRRIQTAPHTVAGEEVGSINSAGYLNVMVDTKLMPVHRLIWLMVHGRLVPEIDHRNTDRTDNRLDNLREATGNINAQNQRRARKNNKLGLLGVTRDGSKYRASIRAGGRPLFLGNFDTPEEAHTAYIAAKRKLHEGCTL